MKLLSLCCALGLLHVGCGERTAKKEPSPSLSVEFALSTPGHIDDWERLRANLTKAGIHSGEGPSDLGTMSLWVAPEEFESTKREAVNLIAGSSLTMRIRSHPPSWIYEVWEAGKKVREESYVIEKK